MVVGIGYSRRATEREAGPVGGRWIPAYAGMTHVRDGSNPFYRPISAPLRLCTRHRDQAVPRKRKSRPPPGIILTVDLRPFDAGHHCPVLGWNNSISPDPMTVVVTSRV